MTRTRAPGSAASRTSRTFVVLVVASALGCAAVWSVAELAGISVTDPDDRDLLPRVAWVLTVLAVLGGTALARLRPAALPGFVAVLAAVAVSGVSAVALNGTAWGFHALQSDSGFRTQAVTRFADSPALADYGYSGLPAYYPPAWPWLLGRTAALLDVPGWTVVKPATLVVAVLVPLVAYLLWRRVVGNLGGALVVLGTTAATAHLQKPDEWLVLAWLLPWWLEVVRGVRLDTVAPRRRWLDGLILGGLLLTHTYFFLPLAIGTVLGWLADLVLRRRPPLGLRDMLVVGLVGLVVASPYWGTMLVARLGHPEADDLQLRWSPRGTEIPPLPFEGDWWGILAAAGLGWLVYRWTTARHTPGDAALALGIALAFTAGYTVAYGGQWLQRLDVALLPHKSHELLVALFVAGGVLASMELVRWVGRHAGGLTVTLVSTALAVGLGVPAALHLTEQWVLGRRAEVAQTMRYPDGSYPGGRTPERPAVAFGTRRGDPSVVAVRRAWRELSGRSAADDSSTVLVTNRVDLLATTPVHSFTPWKSIYSHPLGRFEDRVALLHELARCPTPECAARLLRSNPYDAVDGLIASRDGDDLLLTMGVDNFPEGWSRLDLRLPLRLFTGEDFDRTDVGDVTVIAVRSE
jgi:galactan 5-O-arabinofuranosyltransferase